MHKKLAVPHTRENKMDDQRNDEQRLYKKPS